MVAHWLWANCNSYRQRVTYPSFSQKLTREIPSLKTATTLLDGLTLSSSPCFELRPFSCATTLEWLCSRLVASRKDEPWKKESVIMTSCKQKTSQPVALSTMTTQAMLEMKILWRESLVQFPVAINKGFMYSNLVRTCAWSEQFRPPAVQRHGFMMGPNGLSVVMSCMNPPCPRSGTLNIHSKMVLLWNKHFKAFQPIKKVLFACKTPKGLAENSKFSLNLDIFYGNKQTESPQGLFRLASHWLSWVWWRLLPDTTDIIPPYPRNKTIPRRQWLRQGRQPQEFPWENPRTESHLVVETTPWVAQDPLMSRRSVTESSKSKASRFSMTCCFLATSHVDELAEAL